MGWYCPIYWGIRPGLEATEGSYLANYVIARQLVKQADLLNSMSAILKQMFDRRKPIMVYSAV